MKKYILLLFAIIISGCIYSERVKKPSWAVSVTAANQALSVVKAQKGLSVAMQKRIALLQAKAELSKQIQVQIYSELLLSDLCRAESCQKELLSRSVQKSRNYIQAAKEVESFLDPQDGTFYLLIEINSIVTP